MQSPMKNRMLHSRPLADEEARGRLKDLAEYVEAPGLSEQERRIRKLQFGRELETLRARFAPGAA